jgi:hypothetical protein
MREAVSVIAEYTNSERLKRFLDSGVDREPLYSPDTLSFHAPYSRQH